MKKDISKDLRHNYIVNLLDGAFFGFGIGFATFVGVIQLFVGTLTNSATLIGLVPAIHSAGWQLPQVLIARRLQNMERFRPFVMFMTVQERLPFLGLAITAWLIPTIGSQAALWITFILLIWQALGGGLTANAWQNLIAKIIPSDYRATFLGLQSAAANLFAAGSSTLAGIILFYVSYPTNYAGCFLLAALGMTLSWVFLNMTRETNRPIEPDAQMRGSLWGNIRRILSKDKGFRWFVIVRMMFQFALMASAFYVIYPTQRLGMNTDAAGFMLGELLIAQVVANPLLGWVADRFSRKLALQIGMFAGFLGAILAWLAPDSSYFYIVVVLSALANVAFWVITMALTLDYGTEQERPTYVGIANTLIFPATFGAPLIGGWIADTFGYSVTFITSAAAALVTMMIIQLTIREVRP
jgi:MFS family permease